MVGRPSAPSPGRPRAGDVDMGDTRCCTGAGGRRSVPVRRWSRMAALSDACIIMFDMATVRQDGTFGPAGSPAGEQDCRAVVSSMYRPGGCPPLGHQGVEVVLEHTSGRRARRAVSIEAARSPRHLRRVSSFVQHLRSGPPPSASTTTAPMAMAAQAVTACPEDVGGAWPPRPRADCDLSATPRPWATLAPSDRR